VTDAPETDALDCDALDIDAAETDAPVSDRAASEASIDGLVAAWRAQLDKQSSVPASEVQDRLLDLWGKLPEGDLRGEIERWLTETLERNLYQAADIDARLSTVLSED
jgi:hypothetical protein